MSQWIEQRYHHVHNVPEHHEVRCGCGRLEWASMMQDMRPVPKGRRAYHHDNDWACTQCVQLAYMLGRVYPVEHHHLLGADAAALVVAKLHTQELMDRHAALASRYTAEDFARLVPPLPAEQLAPKGLAAAHALMAV